MSGILGENMIDFFDFSNLHFYLAIGISLLNAAVLCLEGYKFMQIIQLSGYHIKGYFDWLQNTRAKYILRIAMLVLLSSAAMIVTNVIFRGFSEYLGYLGLIFYFLFSAIYIKTIRLAPKKTPLKVTNRVKRSLALLFVLGLLLSFGLILLSSMFVDIFRFGAVALTPLFLPLLVPLVHFMMKPIEKAISRGYVKKAKVKLQANTGLIRIGITGSFGKTSVKNFLHTILSEKYSVCASPLSYNTPMGMTRTILEELNPTHQVLIAEMGARKVGDIAELCDIIQPKFGIITMIGQQHLATFGNLDNIKKTKAELYKSLPKDGFCVFNADTPPAADMYKDCKCGKSKISVCKKADVWAESIQNTSDGTKFLLCVKGSEPIKCQTKLLGIHNITNLLLCVPLALKLGLTLNEVVRGIDKVVPVEHRLQLVKAPNDVLILDDTYNASIEGSSRALQVLGMFDKRRKIVITPGLVELGTMERLANYEFGERIARVADLVIIVNETHYLSIRQGLLDSGFPESSIHKADTVQAAQNILKEILRKSDVVLWENDLPDNYT